MEQWRKTDHPDYEVSNLGRVRSWAKRHPLHKPVTEPRLLRPGIASNGYPTVCFGRGDTRSVHVLVAAAFLGPIPAGQEVRHKDDDRANPRATNLEYGTRQDNVDDMMRRKGHWRHAASR